MVAKLQAGERLVAGWRSPATSAAVKAARLAFRRLRQQNPNTISPTNRRKNL